MQLLNTKTYQRGYSLLGRVVKLIFPGPVEAFLDPGVCPESHHSRQQLWREGLCVLHPTYDVADHLGISLQREERRGQTDAEGRRFQKQRTRPSGAGGCLFGMGLRDPHRMIQQKGQKEDGARFPWKSCPPFALPAGAGWGPCAAHLMPTHIAHPQTTELALHMGSASRLQEEIQVGTNISYTYRSAASPAMIPVLPGS